MCVFPTNGTTDARNGGKGNRDEHKIVVAFDLLENFRQDLVGALPIAAEELFIGFDDATRGVSQPLAVRIVSRPAQQGAHGGFGFIAGGAFDGSHRLERRIGTGLNHVIHVAPPYASARASERRNGSECLAPARRSLKSSPSPEGSRSRENSRLTRAADGPGATRRFREDAQNPI
jgi:hypothetical protein